ncbi:methyltransferase domain-containing protein [Dactylosporangium aurantiacum]|uniref:Methyltransferase domain-containing protein n=1 Tax=Dactylosporangium aurantiacum TaxID=35754 RepID=A0A9Q9MIX1_9ACTN|nr:class I SAM-dependent methyltransferase [Dactylosporangium aurantiacum]MDG6109725.1 methyltransferase domain-containing protein [Dactylosporangium aurantiacum]UWZ56335.1 methyltransferase domain-containing protein [Dactylosporangium aurantiacum]
MTRELWARGDAYEAYVGRWSRPVAARFVPWLRVPPGRRWLDAGCGTGALTGTVLATAAPAQVTGVDPAQPFLTTARSRLAAATPPATSPDAGSGTPTAAGPDAPPATGSGTPTVAGSAGSPTPGSAAAVGGGPAVWFVAGDARALPVADGAVDAVVSGLALNFVPGPTAAVAEFARVVAPGGVVAAYVWDYADGMTMMRHFWDAATSLDPAAAALDEGRRHSICSTGALSDLWSGAGLSEVTARAIDTTAVFAGFDDYWSPFLGGTGPAPTYVASLPADHRDALRELLRARLPQTADGSIPLLTRALAVRGTAT